VGRELLPLISNFFWLHHILHPKFGIKLGAIVVPTIYKEVMGDDVEKRANFAPFGAEIKVKS